MKKGNRCLGFLLTLMPLTCLGQSALPQCKGNDPEKWSNCNGVQVFKAGRYVGEFVGGKLNGFGSLTYVQGDRYVGDWRENKREGFGTYTHPNGNKYVGAWKDGKPHGLGTITFSNRTMFVGIHQDGKRNGEGILYAPDGSVEASGLWKDDVLGSTYLRACK